MTTKQDKFWPICISLTLHLLAAAVIFWGLAGPGLFSPNTDKLTLVWVSVETKTGKVLISETPQSKTKAPAHRQDLVALQTVTTESRRQEDKKLPNVAITDTIEVSYSPSASPQSGGSYALATREKTTVDSMPTQNATGLPAYTRAYPSHRENPRPDYPELARMRGYEGTVLLAAEILADGRVGNIRISKSSGHAILDESAVRNVKTWKFEPAKKFGKPHKDWVEVPYKFLLQDDRYQS